MHAANSVSDSTTGNNNTADHNAAFSRFASCLALQRSAYQADPVPQLKQRLADLDALKALIRDNEQALVDAVNADYGSRCKFETRFSEILMVLEDISRTQKQLKKWLKPQKKPPLKTADAITQALSKITKQTANPAALINWTRKMPPQSPLIL